MTRRAYLISLLVIIGLAFVYAKFVYVTESTVTITGRIVSSDGKPIENEKTVAILENDRGEKAVKHKIDASGTVTMLNPNADTDSEGIFRIRYPKGSSKEVPPGNIEIVHIGHFVKDPAGIHLGKTAELVMLARLQIDADNKTIDIGTYKCGIYGKSQFPSLAISWEVRCDKVQS